MMPAGKPTGRPAIDISGQRFGRLVAVANIVNRGWLCRCDCGAEKILQSGHLREGRIKSCGCATSEFLKAPRKHGQANSRTWAIWSNVIQRCENPKNRAFPKYGGRGIHVCERWHEFANFFADMGHPGEGMSLDRRDNDGPYSPENCRWATDIEQARNKSTNRILEIDGVRKSLAEWCELKNVNYQTAHTRLQKGWTPERALGIDTGAAL